MVDFDRDSVLALDDEGLARECELDFFKASGNGGQKRNKTSSAVRVRHLPTGLVASDSTERQQLRNREKALVKLRMLIALSFRQEPAVPPERSECALAHRDYPLFAAHVADLLAESGWELKPAAEKLGRSTSALLKLLARDPVLWQYANREREKNGLTRLRI